MDRARRALLVGTFQLGYPEQIGYLVPSCTPPRPRALKLRGWAVYGVAEGGMAAMALTTGFLVEEGWGVTAMVEVARLR